MIETITNMFGAAFRGGLGWALVGIVAFKACLWLGTKTLKAWKRR